MKRYVNAILILLTAISLIGCWSKEITPPVSVSGLDNQVAVTGRNLPPAPSASEVDATVLGVDVNKNGVRDEVELYLSSAIPIDEDYFKTIVAAKTYQNMLKQPASSRVEALKLEAAEICDTKKMKGDIYKGIEGLTPWSDRVGSLDTLTFNTDERRKIYALTYNFIAGGFAGSELICE